MEKERKLAQAYLTGRLSRRQMLRAALGMGASLPAIAILVACGQQTSAPAAPAAPAAEAPTAAPAAEAPAMGAATGGTLVMSYRQAVGDTLNQHTSNNTQSRMVARHVLDCLVYIEPSTGEIKPWLATSWEVSEDATTYTFKLREDVTFHDGTPFNAEAVKKNFDYTMDPNTKPGFAYGALGGESYDGTEVIDEFTVQVKFKKPYGVFLIYLSDGGLGIDSPTAFENAGENYGVTTLVGSGPFKFIEWVQNDRVVFEKNPDYNWGPPVAHQGPARLDRIIFQDIVEASTRAAALQNGDVHIAQMAEAQADQLRSLSQVETLLVGRAGTTRMFLMNTAKAPLDDIRVRQAINHATDKEAFIQLPAWSGIGKPGVAPLPSHLMPEDVFSRLTEYDYAYDPDRAIALLEEAGWTMGPNGVRVKDGQELIFDMVTVDGTVPNIEPFDGMLNQVGIKLNIKPGDFNFWIGSVDVGEFDITLMSDSGYNAPGLVEEFFHSAASYNDYGFSDPQVDQYLEAALAAPDRDEQWENLEAAMAIIMQNAVGVMAWEQQFIYGKRGEVMDARFNEIGFPYFYETWIAAA